MEIGITAIGTANPPNKRRQQDAAEFMGNLVNAKPSQKRLIKAIYKATGIEHRYSAVADYGKMQGDFEFFPNDPAADFPGTSARMKHFKEHAIQLALTAIENCLKQLNDFDLQKITHVVTVSCTGMYAPGIDIEIVERLKLQSTTKRTAINFMGCYGAFNGLKVARDICKADPAATVLMVSVELCTIHFQKNLSMDNIISNAIFSDGAAAVIVQSNPAAKKYLNLTDFHCDLLPQTNKEMAWHIGDNGFDIVLSSYVPEVIRTGIKDFVQNLLAKSEMTLTHIDYYAIHPGGAKILSACEEALNITTEDNRYSYQTLRDYGNMSSATVLFVLKALWDDMKQSDHDKTIFSCAFGPGLTLESMLMNIRYV